MVLEPGHRSSEIGHHIDIRCFGGQDKGEGGQAGLAIQSRSADAGPGKKMSNRFQLIRPWPEISLPAGRLPKISILTPPCRLVYFLV